MSQYLRLLIIDDNADDALLIVRRIRSSGFTVSYQCIASAPAMAKALNEQCWDAIITDVNMPGFSAAGALALYKEVGCTCPFIVTSGVISEESAVSLLRAGAHDFVLKSNLARLVPALEREFKEAEVRRAKRVVEKALRVSEQRYALAAKGANDGLWDWDLDTGQVFYSPRWKEMLGLESNEEGQVIGEWLNRIHPDDAKAVQAALRAHLEGRTAQFAAEHRLRHADGQWRWVLARGLATTSEAGPQRVVGSLTDTTAYHQAEEDARRAMEEAQRAKDETERALTAKTGFLAAASHDLRQPVQALLLYCTVLVGSLGSHPAGRVAHEMEQALAALKALLDSLLDISKLDAGLVTPHVSQMSLDTLMAQLAHEVGPVAAAKGITLRFVPRRMMVKSDPVLLGRMLRNLLDNAIKYTEGGKILLGCRGRGSEVVVTVADTGIGISANNLSHIFDEFYQVANTERDRRKGLGLGLAIVQRLAGVLGHRVGVSSQPGQGSCFEVIVPKADHSRGPNCS